MNYSNDFEEKTFLLKNVMKVNVLTYAESFKSLNFPDFLNLIEAGEKFAEDILAPLNQLADQKRARLQENIIKTPPGFKAAWQKLKKGGWPKICAPAKYGGKGNPESVGIAVYDAFSAANPAFYYYLMQTIETAKLIDQLGAPEQKELFCQKLFDCEWSGCFSLENISSGLTSNGRQIEAKPGGEYYLISGTQSAVIGARPDLTDNCIHIVPARFTNTKKTECKFGLFIVPFSREESGSVVDNDIELAQSHSPIGIKGAPASVVTYGANGNCHGYLIDSIDQDLRSVLNTLNNFRLQIALLSTAQSNSASNFAVDFVLNSAQDSKTTAGQAARSLTPFVADATVQMKAISEGLRGAVYMAAFFTDCLFQGAELQNEFFSDLIHIYSRLLKVYAVDWGLKILDRGLGILGDTGYTDDINLEQSYRDLKAGMLVGRSNDTVSEEFINDVLLVRDGRMVTNLVKQFESVEVHQARTEALREAIYVWQDYIGGIIVLVDDLKKDKESGNHLQKWLFSDKILRYFGDVVLCYHLIYQGLEAEKILEEAGLNFYNLREEVIKKPEFRRWYNKLIYAEYFALNILSLQEAAIHIMQRNSSSALDVVL